MRSNERLQYYMHDEPDAFRLELSGSLSGGAARDVYHAWRTALSVVGERPVIVDMTYTNEADEHGRALLVSWRRSGARIIASSATSRRLAESILGEPFADPPAKPTFLQSLGAWARSSAAKLAEIAAGAETRNSTSAPAQHEHARFIAVADRHHVECRMP